MRLPEDYKLDLSGAKILTLPLEMAEQFARPKEAGDGPRPLPQDAMLRPRIPGDPDRCWTVTIPDWHPTRANQLNSMHPMTRSSYKRHDAITLGKALRNAGVPAATGKRRLVVAILIGPKGRQPDADAFDKSLWDGLVRCGALAGDDPDRLDAPRPTFERPGAKGIRITLEDIP